MTRRKKIIPRQLKCSTQKVQYDEIMIEDVRKKYEDTINTYIKMVMQRSSAVEKQVKVLEKIWYLTHHPVFSKNKPEKF